MTLMNEIKELQKKLTELYEKYNSLIHPAVVTVSQMLDRKIMDYYRREGYWK